MGQTIAASRQLPNTGVNAQTGTAYTLAAADSGKIITLTNAAAITLTVPTNLGAGFNCIIVQNGAGVITITPAAGVTVRQRQSFTKTAGLYAIASLVSNAANNFFLGGDLVT